MMHNENLKTSVAFHNKCLLLQHLSSPPGSRGSAQESHSPNDGKSVREQMETGKAPGGLGSGQATCHLFLILLAKESHMAKYKVKR